MLSLIPLTNPSSNTTCILLSLHIPHSLHTKCLWRNCLRLFLFSRALLSLPTAWFLREKESRNPWRSPWQPQRWLKLEQGTALGFWGLPPVLGNALVCPSSACMHQPWQAGWERSIWCNDRALTSGTITTFTCWIWWSLFMCGELNTYGHICRGSQKPEMDGVHALWQEDELMDKLTRTWSCRNLM